MIRVKAEQYLVQASEETIIGEENRTEQNRTGRSDMVERERTLFFDSRRAWVFCKAWTFIGHDLLLLKFYAVRSEKIPTFHNCIDTNSVGLIIINKAY
jgi:hypothetical protein